ncbi:MAG TPA: hypothetical protein VIJ04_05390 [Xanthobacteraceae bacterium]
MSESGILSSITKRVNVYFFRIHSLIAKPIKETVRGIASEFDGSWNIGFAPDTDRRNKRGHSKKMLRYAIPPFAAQRNGEFLLFPKLAAQLIGSGNHSL